MAQKKEETQRRKLLLQAQRAEKARLASEKRQWARERKRGEVGRTGVSSLVVNSESEGSSLRSASITESEKRTRWPTPGLSPAKKLPRSVLSGEMGEGY